MKMILLVADAARQDAIRADLSELQAPGYSMMPLLEGSGRTGMHAADRVHPGGLVMFMIVDRETAAVKLFEELARRRDLARDTVSRMFLVPIERQA